MQIITYISYHKNFNLFYRDGSFTYYENIWLTIFWLLFHVISSVQNKIFFLRYKFVYISVLSFIVVHRAMLLFIISRMQLRASSRVWSWLWAGNVVQKIIVDFTLNVWLSPVREDPRRESGTVIVFCYGGTRGFGKCVYTLHCCERARALRTVRTRGAPQLIKVL